MKVTNEESVEIMKAVRAAMEDAYKTPKYYEAHDVILSPAQVSEEFPFITQHFLKRYGWCIPRERVEKWDDETCKSKFGYSRNLIIELINSGELRRIKPYLFTANEEQL